ncbi:hypothetical protein EDC19_0658 [Natranaerovirga hydrolytica]|uniref:FAD-dependent protein C-terminal domain-containing protein n=1 Tax=Natranaerovirga hydrolytica TaxID=680378 RepID=A0A4R1MY78_9FIRM|nr:hypothetical protein [Natranaerovirga hydrolytica]TCK98238.1 hypothetical protein EDC19_0658 [Natranaerovirga hydrolytica]
MIRINQLKFDINHKEEDILLRICKKLKINKEHIVAYTLSKKSIDARKENDIKIVYAIDVTVENEEAILKDINDNNVMLTKEKIYTLGEVKINPIKERPVIIGTGPAGLFCALILAENGFNPLIIERGKPVEERIKDVNAFWKGKPLNPNSNVQFGEGGAGTFSDGKLNTMVKDRFARNKKVLETFVEAGAPSEILYYNKPHIGTDYLREVVKNMRKKLIALGAEIRFNTTLTNIISEDDTLKAIEVNDQEVIPCSHLVLAIGHSARDTFEMLYKNNITMDSKPFAIGVRIEHPQTLINKNQYGKHFSHPNLPVAEYKLTHKCKNGRSIYSFCMCPGGLVVNAASETGRIVTNGMSNYKRNEENANSAIIVTVKPEDFSSNEPLAGVAFQRKWEEKAFEIGGQSYKIPIQLVKDFIADTPSKTLGKVIPSFKEQKVLTNLNEALPKYVIESIKEGLYAFDKKIKGFAMDDAILSGVETRTSSPIRINRDETYQSNIKGVYPCGEGAGYAGGITSAAMDGIKTAEAIMAIKR